MKKDISFASIKIKLQAALPKIYQHVNFAAVIIILLVFIFTVWRISQLASAEPSPDQEGTSDVTNVPKVDPKALSQVTQLENNSPQVHALFNQARNNPFGE